MTNLLKSSKKVTEPHQQFYGPRVTIISEQEKKLQKQVKKEEKKIKKMVASGFQQDQILSALGFDSELQRKIQDLEKSSSLPLFESQNNIKYPNVYSTTPQTFLSMYGSKYSLPIGTTRLVIANSLEKEKKKKEKKGKKEKKIKK